MTGTTEDIKKAQKIIIKVKNFFIYYRDRLKMQQQRNLDNRSDEYLLYYKSKIQAELTALDIVQYEQYIGGLSRASTILEELTEKLDFRGASNKLFGYTSIATIQRLGYILDEVLNAAEIADTLYMELTSYVKRFKYIPLTINKPKDCAERNNRWKIFVNTIIETDEI